MRNNRVRSVEYCSPGGKREDYQTKCSVLRLFEMREQNARRYRWDKRKFHYREINFHKTNSLFRFFSVFGGKFSALVTRNGLPKRKKKKETSKQFVHWRSSRHFESSSARTKSKLKRTTWLVTALDQKQSNLISRKILTIST